MRKIYDKMLKDTCVLYFSKADSSWIAHTLHTDQIGIGNDVLEVLVDIISGLNDLLALKKKDRRISLYREAPFKIQRLARKAESLPEEIGQIAFRKIHGDWPKGIKFNVETLKKQPFRAEITNLIGGLN